MQKEFTDQLGRVIQFNFPPHKIISLVPSQTELLYDLGLREEVVGITKFCIHPPEWTKTKTIVGGTKTLNIELITQLAPDLIIANKEENEQLQIETLAARFPVYISDIKDLDGALEMIQQVGAITQKDEAAVAMCNDIADLFASISSMEKIRKKVAYLIWRKPFMAVNSDTFIHDMLQKCGYENVFADAKSRYPEISLDTLKEAAPDFIFLSSEPYPFKELHVDELLDAGVVNHQEQIILVDGEMFSWYGSHLLKAVNYFKELQEATLLKCTHLLGS